MSEIEPDRGEVVSSVERDSTSLLAQNAFNRAVDARTRADAAYDLALSVSSNASNANLNATTAQSLANAAQADIDALTLTAITTAGATLYGPLFLPYSNPAGYTEAAHKGYVDYAVSTMLTNSFDSLQASKADKTYVDTADADLQAQIDTGSAQITDLYTKVLPAGAIIMWSGSIGSIPSGWRLCDGTGGTPDLRNKFVIGAGSTYAPSASGGTTSLTTSSSGDHTHSGTISTAGDHTHTGTIFGTSLTVDQLPPHYHNFTINKSDADSSGGTSFVKNITTGTEPTTVSTQSTGSGNPHTHSASINNAGGHTHTATLSNSGTHTHTATIIPPYYALCFIMKT